MSIVRDAYSVRGPRGSSFVGRATELAVVDTLLAAVRGGTTAALVVAGEAGIGKSCLVGEMRTRAAATGMLVATGRTPVEGVGLPYGTLVGLLRDLRRQLGPKGNGTLEPLQRLVLGDDVAEHGQLARLALFEAALTAVVDISAQRPLVFVLEDIHWADAGSVDLLDHLVRNLEDEPVLVVVTYRPEELDTRPPLRKVVVELRRLSVTTMLELTGLSRDDVATLVANAAGEPPSWTVVDAIHRRSGGNPLFAEELVDVRDRHVLPGALRDLLKVRIDRLGVDARRVVSAASVLGATPDHRVLAAVADLDGPALDAALEQAVLHGVLVPDGDTGIIRFRHALLQETTHAELLPHERARLHGRAAVAIEANPALAANGAGSLDAQLAEHRFEAGDWAGACEASITAAQAGLALYSIHAAHAQLQRALEAHRRSNGSCRHGDVDEAELYRLAADTSYLASDLEAAADLAAQAAATLPPDASPSRVASIYTLVARAGQGDERSFAFVAEANERLRHAGDAAALAEIVCMHGRLLMAVGRNEESIERCEEALALARGSGARIVEGHALATLAPSLGELGLFERAVAAGAESIAIAEDVGDADLLMRAYTNLGHVYMLRGDLSATAQLGLDAMGDTTILGSIRLASAGFNSADALIHLGRWEEAAAMSAAMSGKASAACVGDAINQSLLALRQGDVDAAELELSRRQAVAMQSVSQAELVKAEIAIERQQYDDALAAVDRCLTSLAGSDYAVARLRAHALALQALADRELLPVRPGRRSAVDPTKALRAAEAILADVDEAFAVAVPPTGTPSLWLVALRALCRAEATRLRGSDPEAWSVAADEWAAFEDPYHRAYSRLREAEALLSSRGDRPSATKALTDAWETARQLGAPLLIGRCQRLADRARVPLAEPRAADASPRDRAAADLGLTPREAEVFALLARERTDRQIAEELFISKKTASVHVSNILRKLDARDRWHAGELARAAGLT
jgi:DNA-binding CsgD family transcriptional regulator